MVDNQTENLARGSSEVTAETRPAPGGKSGRLEIEEQVIEALRNLIDPDLHRDVVSLGMIQNLRVCDGVVAFKFVLTTPNCPVRQSFEDQARQLVMGVPGVKQVNVEMSANAPRKEISKEDVLPGVHNVIAVSSGKGGVGKSTVAVEIAVAIGRMYLKAGLMDCDVYGPNVPTMMGLEAPKLYKSEKGLILMPEQYNVKVVSLGFFMEKTKPVIWRGPMVHGIIKQFVEEVDWGELDYLIMDLPPGTGDAQLTVSQIVPLTGAIIVITPSQVAVEDGIKGYEMFKQMSVPVLGIVENMSHFICPHCNERTDIYSESIGEKLASHLGVPLLGSIPLDPKICMAGDTGKPLTYFDAESPQAKVFYDIVSNMLTSVLEIDKQRKSAKVTQPTPVTK